MTHRNTFDPTLAQVLIVTRHSGSHSYRIGVAPIPSPGGGFAKFSECADESRRQGSLLVTADDSDGVVT